MPRRPRQNESECLGLRDVNLEMLVVCATAIDLVLSVEVAAHVIAHALDFVLGCFKDKDLVLLQCFKLLANDRILAPSRATSAAAIRGFALGDGFKREGAAGLSGTGFSHV